jgi:ABC-type proline/glycine betaine transport systems, permease component
VNLVIGALAWIVDPAHVFGPAGLLTRTGEHVLYTVLTLLIAALIALPVGLLVGHSGKGRSGAVVVTGALRALPTLGMVLLLALWLGAGFAPPLIVLVALALPPVLAGAYSGVGAVSRDTVDAARAVGMTSWQVLSKVEIPLAMPLIVGGLRSACLQVIATWTVAAYLPVGGLGRPLIDGLSVQNYSEMLGGSIVVIALALVADGVFAIVQRVVVPRGVILGRPAEVRASTGRQQTAPEPG